MTPVLSDAQVERDSRQILLPEVGGRGQARLLASRLLVAGSGEAARIAGTLAARAGVGHLGLLGASGGRPDPGPDCRVREVGLEAGAAADVVIDLTGEARLGASLGVLAQAAGHPFIVGAMCGSGATLATLVGRPCVRCLAPGPFPRRRPGTVDALAAPLALALGALALDEALLALLVPPPRGRLHLLGLDDGTLAAHPLDAPDGCTVCAARA
jgi:molybdopterin/thiamine biosynthesis adenylyltransferase